LGYNQHNQSPASDTDRDDLALLVEDALGGSPAFNDEARLPEGAVIDGHLTCRESG